MSHSSFPNDPLWPRAGYWILPMTDTMSEGDLALLGIPAHQTSISPTGADATPGAVREALLRYSTYSATHDVDVASLRAVDLGDVTEPDGPEGEQRVRQAVAQIAGHFRLLIALGGDNSITYPVMQGLFGEDLAHCGLITVDAHHDLRNGESNGSPVRRLVEAGLPGAHIVQIGIADFANSAAYAAQACELGITVVQRAQLRGRPPEEVAARALETAGYGGRPVFVDLDVDVCDRAEVPGCPASAPGGISADYLRQLAYFFSRDERVRGIDITEVDATADAPDGRTVRLAALLVLEAAAGLAERQ
ncbi:MAG: arginase family protein [Coriobacteriia bacterium]|nr:arginase family protein [Coriobacteriia bacterium]